MVAGGSQLQGSGVGYARAGRRQVFQQALDVADEGIDPCERRTPGSGRRTRAVDFLDAPGEKAGRRTRSATLEVVEAGRDLNQPLHQAALIAGEIAPHVFPELVRLEERAAVEGGSAGLKAGVEGSGGRDGLGQGVTVAWTV